MAFDGSASGDSIAVIGCTMDGHLFVLGLWERSADDPPLAGAPRRRRRCRRQRVHEYDVVELACDSWGRRSEIES